MLEAKDLKMQKFALNRMLLMYSALIVCFIYVLQFVDFMVDIHVKYIYIWKAQGVPQ